MFKNEVEQRWLRKQNVQTEQISYTNTRAHSTVDSKSNCRTSGREFDTESLVIFMDILLLLMISEGWLSVTSESMCRKYINCLVWLAQKKCCKVDMAIAVDWDVKLQIIF